mgnify:CR=1 FL=1
MDIWVPNRSREPLSIRAGQKTVLYICFFENDRKSRVFELEYFPWKLAWIHTFSPGIIIFRGLRCYWLELENFWFRENLSIMDAVWALSKHFWDMFGDRRSIREHLLDRDIRFLGSGAPCETLASIETAGSSREISDFFVFSQSSRDEIIFNLTI